MVRSAVLLLLVGCLLFLTAPWAPGQTDTHGDALPSNALARLGTTRWRQQWSSGNLFHAADGKLLALGRTEQTIGLWDVAAGKLLRQWPAEKPFIWPQVPLLSQDGKTVLVVGGDQNLILQLFDLETGKEQRKIKSPQRVYGLAISSDGKHLATAHWVDGKKYLVRLWDAVTGNELRQFEEAGTALTFSPDDKMLLIGSEQRLRVCDVANGKELRKWECVVRTLAVSADGKTLATRGEGIVQLWDLATGQEKRTIHFLVGQQQLLFDTLALSAEGQTVALGGLGHLFAWDAATGKPFLARVDGVGAGHVLLSPDGKTLVWSAHPVIHRWDLAAGRELLAISGHTSEVTSLAFLPDGTTLATGAALDSIRLWKIAERRQAGEPAVVEVKGHPLAYSPDGKLLAVGEMDKSEKKVRLRETVTGQEVRTLEGTAQVTCLVFSPDGKTLAGGDNYTERGESNPRGRIYFWDTASGRLLRTIDGCDSPVRSLAISPDGKTLASGSQDGIVRLWGVAGGQQVRRFARQSDYVEGVVFTPDGRTVISGGTPVVIWDAVTGDVRRRLASGHGYTTALTIAPDGKVLATGGRDNLIRLWDLESGEELAELTGHKDWVNVLGFSRDGKTLASGGKDTTVLLWDVPAALVKRKPEPANLERLWEDLAKVDAVAAHKAVWAMVAEPERTVPFLKERLKPDDSKSENDPPPFPIPAGEPLRAVRAIQVLEQIDTPNARQVLEALSKGKSVRSSREARAALERLDQLHAKPVVAVPVDPLEQAWKDLGEADAASGHKAIWKLVAEPEKSVALLKTRLKPAVAASDDSAILVPPGDALRTVRAIEVLEHIGTAAARQVLETLSKGAPSRSTRAAKAALERLDQRTGDQR